MPAAKPCPSCPAIITTNAARCPTCTAKQRRASRQRNGRDDNHYSTSTWRRTRTQVLQHNPHCPCGKPAQVVDHNPPRRQLIAAGINNPDHPRWLIALCKPCHDHKTATQDGGFGHTPHQHNLKPLTHSDNPQGYNT